MNSWAGLYAAWIPRGGIHRGVTSQTIKIQIYQTVCRHTQKRKYNHLTCNKQLYILLFSHKYLEKISIYFKFDIILYCVLLLYKWSEVAQLCLTLCNPMDCSLSGFSVHGIFQARVLEWGAISFSKRSSRPKDQTQVSHIVGRCFTVWATREVTYQIWDII